MKIYTPIGKVILERLILGLIPCNRIESEKECVRLREN
jgi:hypothetical protein